MELTLTSVPYIPSSPLTGGESLVVYRGKNMILRGLAPRLYYEVYAGSENLSEPIPAVALTGTLAFSPSSLTVTGSGTLFLSELHVGGQIVKANGEVLSVVQILSDTEFLTGRLPITTEAAVTGYRCPNLFPLDIKRGSQLTGNALHYDRGTILSVGSGTLYVNGAVLAGTSLTATRKPKVALYNSALQTYTVEDIGFTTVPTIANTDVTVVGSGGTKNMSLGYYSFRIAYYSDATSGRSNATDVLLSGGTAGYQITLPNSRINFDFSGDVRPAKATGYIIYGTAFAGQSSTSAVNAIQGGWFQIGDPVPFDDLVANQLTLDYVDSDLSTLVSFDNDPPPDAELFGSLDRYPVLISTNGAGVGNLTRKRSTNPGPYVSPIKAENFDAYPDVMKVPTEKGEIIIGAISAAGRIFVLTSNTLQAVTLTGLPSAPVTCRPFWKRGFQGANNLVFVDDTLYGFTTAGVFRSIAAGDEGSESHVFASDVESDTAGWHGSYVFVAHDPKNEQVCFIYSASRQNAFGYWETDILPYSLRQQQWQPPVVLSSATRDMTVSGVATVNGHLEFIAGGRRAAMADQWDTFRYDTGSIEDVDWYIAFNYTDLGTEYTAKTIRKTRIKGKFTDATVQIYTISPDSAISIDDLETGTNPAYEYALDNSTTVTQYGVNKSRVRNAMMCTARIEGTSNWDGVSEKDQFHELACEVEVYGQMR
jgi:hypothetical protein